MATATFGAGCFWCVEAVFRKLAGVDQIKPGYINGKTADPTYQQVCTGLTGHAEVIQIDFQPELVSFEVLLEVLFHVHDPTTLNRQGADTGTQYRSGIYFHHEEQQQVAEAVNRALTKLIYGPIPLSLRLFPPRDFIQQKPITTITLQRIRGILTAMP